MSAVVVFVIQVLIVSTRVCDKIKATVRAATKYELLRNVLPCFVAEEVTGRMTESTKHGFAVGMFSSHAFSILIVSATRAVQG